MITAAMDRALPEIRARRTMMDSSTYTERRQRLRRELAEGAILIMGSELAPRNYRDNVYPRYRQDSSFLYYFGVSEPGMAALLLPDGEEVLYGRAEHPDDLIWFGPHKTVHDHALAAGVGKTGTAAQLGEVISDLIGKGVKIHYLPPYREDRTVALARLLDKTIDEVEAGASPELIHAIVGQRSIKSEAEIAEIEDALAVTAEMYRAAMSAAAVGRTEAEVAAALQAEAFARDRDTSFPPIVTVHGEVLHNTSYANTLEDGDLLLIDSGAESPRFYASDITRTFPVNGKFRPEQAEVYEVVLEMQTRAIASASPQLSNRDLHLQAARVAVDGLKQMGLMKGDPDAAVAAGAHALFFPHGLGHMMGLDVHDMEDLGDVVGYPEGEPRSTQFGLSFLRLARKLEPGFVLTIEPGIYFVPALIDKWQGEGLHREHICYDRLAKLRSFGGIRIEDDLLITETGSRVLGPGIIKTVTELEHALTS
jgi:Xaa-Pro aminopeptidase